MLSQDCRECHRSARHGFANRPETRIWRSIKTYTDMHRILVTSENNANGCWIELDHHTAQSFRRAIKELFGNDGDFFVKSAENVPFEFYHAGVGKRIIAKRFWDWKDYSPEDKELLIRYMAVSQDDASTIEMARAYFLKHPHGC